MVSIIIPAYNGERTIEQCIDSVLKVNWPREQLEIIIVNDGSTDNTGRIIENFQESFTNIKIVNQKNGGAAAARSAGLRNAQSKYVFMLSQDASAHPEWIKDAVDAFKQDSRIGIVQGKICLTEEITIPYYHATQLLRPARNFPTAAIAYLGDALDKAGRYFDVRLSEYGDDTDLAWRILSKGYCSKWIDTVTAYHGVFPVNGFGYYIRRSLGAQAFALLVKNNPRLRQTFVIPFVWGSPYRLLEFLLCAAGIFALPFNLLAGVGLLLTSFLVCYLFMLLSLSVQVSPLYRHFILPIDRYICDLTATAAMWYGAVRHRCFIL